VPVTRDRATDVLAGVLGGVGSLHFVAGEFVEAILPRWVPAKRAVVYGSGALEMVCALGLARRKRWAGPPEPHRWPGPAVPGILEPWAPWW
jgi:uncharacterized membrane protein